MILGLLENLLLHALLLLWQVVVTGELATVAHKTLKDLLAEECLYFAAESSYCLNKMWHERSHCHPEQTDDSTTKCRWFTAHIVQAVRAVHSWLTTWPRENHNTADTTPKLLEKLRCSRVLPAFQKIFFIWLHILVKKIWWEHCKKPVLTCLGCTHQVMSGISTEANSNAMKTQHHISISVVSSGRWEVYLINIGCWLFTSCNIKLFAWHI